MNIDSDQAGKYRLSVKGIIAYLTLWAVFFAICRVLAQYSSIGATGSYPRSAALVTDFVLPLAIGIFFVAIGVTVAYLLGSIKHVRVIAVWCFVIGSCSLAMLWIVVVSLAGVGILDLD